MDKIEILKLYISDLKNIVKQSDARDSRIETMEKELEIASTGVMG